MLFERACLQTLLGDLGVLRVQFDADTISSESLSSKQGAAHAQKRVKHGHACLRETLY